MKTAPQKSTDELRMSGKEFDTIMRRALQVQPEETPKPKKVVKAKSKVARKKAGK